ncbi:MAG: TonB-dependent receptor [Gemmatimonadetes bacterium]|nr:TonB-dependent receptor [Gemmatimonadota bacterium]
MLQQQRANRGAPTGPLSSSSEFSASWATTNCAPTPLSTRGYLLYPPALFNQIGVDQNVERVTASLNGTWRPLSWLSLTGLGGVDYAGRSDQAIVPPDLIPGPDNRNIGSRTSNPYGLWTYTGNTSATAQWRPWASIEANTSLGTQFNREVLHGTQAFGRGLAAGTGSLGGTTSGFAVAEQNQEIVTLGVFAQQRVAWRDKLFFTASLRGDDNSNFGTNLQLVTYPAASLSWVVNEESWFPQVGWLVCAPTRRRATRSLSATSRRPPAPPRASRTWVR